MCLSLVSTTHSRRPTSASQISSWVFCGKCSSWVLTCSPAWRRAFGMIFPPSERSIKKTGGSGSEGELTTNSLFDLRSLAAVIVGQFVYRLAGFVALSHDVRGDSSACENRAAKRNMRINYDVLRFVQCAFASERVKSDCQSRRIMFNALQVSDEEFADCELPRL